MPDRLAAMDVEKQDFNRVFRGFAEDEVRIYLKSVADEIQSLNLQNSTQKEELSRFQTEMAAFRSRETALQDALVAAQRLADQIREKSRAEADLMLREARMKSERVLQQSQDQLARIDDEIGRARLERDSFENRLRGAIEQHLDLLELRKRERQETDNLRVLRRVGGSEAG
jgi:cell division initiation protein